jgi:hypothetical protein
MLYVSRSLLILKTKKGRPLNDTYLLINNTFVKTLNAQTSTRDALYNLYIVEQICYIYGDIISSGKNSLLKAISKSFAPHKEPLIAVYSTMSINNLKRIVKSFF